MDLFGIVSFFALVYYFFFMGKDEDKKPQVKTVYEDYEIINGIVVYKKGIDITI